MQSTHVIRRSVLGALLGTVADGRPAAAADVTLLNVSYDPTRELYRDMNRAFIAAWQMKTGQRVTINQSHGGSGAQARAVLWVRACAEAFSSLPIENGRWLLGRRSAGKSWAFSARCSNCKARPMFGEVTAMRLNAGSAGIARPASAGRRSGEQGFERSRGRGAQREVFAPLPLRPHAVKGIVLALPPCSAGCYEL